MQMDMIFKLTLVIGSAIFALLGVLCLSIRTPKEPIYRPFNYAKRTLSAVMLLLSLNFIARGSFHALGLDRHIPFLDLVFYSTAMLLMTITSLTLLDPRYSRRRLWQVGLVICGMEAVMAGVAIGTSGALSAVMVVICSVGLLLFILWLAGGFQRKYLRMRKLVDNYYDETADYLSWLRRSLLFMVLTALACIWIIYDGAVSRLVTFVYMVATAVYVYISFNNYLYAYPRIEHVLLSVTHPKAGAAADDIDAMTNDNEVVTTSENDYGSLNTQQLLALKQWREQKGYHTAGITITQLAAIIGCNRFYLSQYINGNYNVSFSDWIARMRVEEAKALMREDARLALGDIACRVGFSSGSYFTKTFTRFEGVSPAQWRRAYHAALKSE